MAEFEYSHDKHVLGTDWKSRVRDKEDLKITAYHEAGHTLVAFFTENATPLHKVRIEIFKIDPRGRPIVTRPVVIIVFAHVVRPSPLFKTKQISSEKQCPLLAVMWVWPSGSLMTPVLC